MRCGGIKAMHIPVRGADLGYGAGSSSMSYNMAVWFSNSLNRQLLDRSKIDAPKENVYLLFIDMK